MDTFIHIDQILFQIEFFMRTERKEPTIVIITTDMYKGILEWLKEVSNIEPELSSPSHIFGYRIISSDNMSPEEIIIK